MISKTEELQEHNDARRQAIEAAKALLQEEAIEVEDIAPVGELAEAYVATTKEIKAVYDTIDALVNRGNAIADQLLKHYGMKVNRLAFTYAPQQAVEKYVEEDWEPTGNPGIVHQRPVTATISDIRAESQIPGASEEDFARGIAANFEKLQGMLK